jgi:cobalt-zinc-cadmium efflux system membrane fusion protein
MTAEEQTAAGLRIEVLAPMSLGEVLQAPGEVVDNAYGVTLITPRVESLVVRRHARLGDEVAAGAALVSLSSVEVAEAQGELRIAEQEWQRVQSLGKEAVSGRRYTEAAVAVEQARAKARAYGIAGSVSGPADGEYTLSAPHAGRLTEDDFVIGQRIEPGFTLFRLVDESTVWVDATLPAEIARRVVVGKDATVVAAGVRLPGRVVQSAHRTAEDTRNAHVRVEVPNEGDQLHAGDFVEVSLSVDGSGIDQLAVPTEAIVQLQGQTVVFREKSAGQFEPVPVKAGAVVGDHTILAAGVTAGDRVVVAGTYALKARMLKAQLGEGHGH